MKRLLLTLGLVALAGPALAHPGHALPSGFAAGALHPLTGADHLLAMLAVGLWSGFALPRHVWAGAAAFLTAMTAGAALGIAGIALPGVEAVILASVVVLGALTLSARAGQPAWRTLAALAAIAGFALFHGHAHAAEATGAALAFVAGFLTSTAALHLAGIALARAVAGRRRAGLLQRLIGGGIALAGLYLAIG